MRCDAANANPGAEVRSLLVPFPAALMHGSIESDRGR